MDTDVEQVGDALRHDIALHFQSRDGALIDIVCAAAS